MNRPRAADDFATIRARMEELRRERERERRAKPKYSQIRQCGPRLAALTKTSHRSVGFVVERPIIRSISTLSCSAIAAIWRRCLLAA